MRSLALPLLVLAAAGTLLPPAPARAIGAFDYAVDRFEVVGNQPGSLFDEFDDDVQDWIPNAGTVVETGGALHLQSPGLIDGDSFAALNPDIVLERSDTLSPARFNVTDGAGDFDATSTWSSLPSAPGGFYTMGHGYVLPGNLFEVFSVSVRDFDTQTLVSPYPGVAGLAFGASHVVFDMTLRQLVSYEAQSFSVDPSSISGDVLLQLHFDDATDRISGGFSIDGGAHFMSPFSAYDSNLANAMYGFGNFNLFGDPTTVVPEPSTGVLLGIGLVLLGRGRRQR